MIADEAAEVDDSNHSGKNWVFTLFAPEGAVDEPINWYDEVERVIFLAYQAEICPDSGRFHYQGYLRTSRKCKLTWLKNNVNARAHWERRYGTHEEARDYANKEESRVPLTRPVCIGEEPQGGRRTDLEILKEDLDAGMSLKEISDDHFHSYLRFGKMIKEYQVLHRQNTRDWQTQTVVYWGEPGVGKSRRALEEGGLDAYWLARTEGTPWWDGYDGHDVVVIDEFMVGMIRRDIMCRLCDRYPLLVPVKGGMIPFVAKRIIITSNHPPSEWYPRIGLGPLERRLSEPHGAIVEMKQGDWEPSVADDALAAAMDEVQEGAEAIVALRQYDSDAEASFEEDEEMQELQDWHESHDF